MPSIAYRIRAGDRSIVFGSDQNGSDERFTSFAAGVDALIMHFGLSTRAPDPIVQVHARPAVVGQVAQKAKAKRLATAEFLAFLCC